MQHAISWFEIPVHDLERARRFYEAVLGVTLQTLKLGQGPALALFPVDPARGVGGALACGRGYVPAREVAGERVVHEGVKVYLNAGDDLGPALERVATAGGRVAVPKTQISPDFGFMGAFVDTEGNWVGLHSTH